MHVLQFKENVALSILNIFTNGKLFNILCNTCMPIVFNEVYMYACQKCLFILFMNL